ERRDVDAAHLEHVVAAAAVGVVAVLAAGVLVAAAGPFAGEGVLGLAAAVPVHQGGAGPVDLQLADLAGAAFAAVVADDAQLVTRHRLAGGAVAHPARAVGQEDVQHL